ncbi:hypothetical protein [Streptomyces sp. XD-27]|uniref:hypothetical protein n=1 Tax=Streptomyces sp. XD-27 TaxID=3062779 RepID=UPI0026F464F4|nr:hypothetical protein [Streptomyces sp. XD-27]WKX73014.1 hypothetical protein Q3Y56_26730 [Streptomyces sp. XD-27]
MYGTIIGAGVVSVVATAGGSVFQHLFRRTGEQLKEVTVQARPKSGTGARDSHPPVPGAYGEATTHGTRLRGWKRPALAAGTVFALAMGAITGIEMFSGGPVSNVWGGDHGGTTVGNSVGDGGSRRSTPRPDPTPGAPSPGGETPAGGGATPTPTPTPSKTPTGDGDGTSRPDGTATPTPSPTPTPTPSPGTGATGGDAGHGDEDGTDTGATTPPATPANPATGDSNGGTTAGR